MTQAGSRPETPPLPSPRGGPGREARLFLLALGFLTRLGPARAASEEDMRASSFYYPAVGVVLGCLLIAPLWCGLGRLPLAGGWAYALLAAWLTRGLHHDGLADLADAVGAGATGERFWEIVKDSRLGALGALALILAVVGQVVLAATCLEAGRLLPLLYAPLLGRCLPALFPLFAGLNPGAGLGRLSSPGTASMLFAACLAVPPGIFCLGLPAAIIALCLCFLVLLCLGRVARRQGGYNGDFLGALILLGELCALLALPAYAAVRL